MKTTPLLQWESWGLLSLSWTTHRASFLPGIVSPGGCILSWMQRWTWGVISGHGYASFIFQMSNIHLLKLELEHFNMVRKEYLLFFLIINKCECIFFFRLSYEIIIIIIYSSRNFFFFWNLGEMVGMGAHRAKFIWFSLTHRYR